MKVKNFQEYLNKRLNSQEIAELEEQANSEYQALRSLQQDLSKAINEYMQKENIDFNELVRRLGISPTQLNKIQKGEANITLASVAHISALLKKQPQIIFK